MLTANFAGAAGVTVDEVSFSFTSSTWGGEITNAAVRALVIFLVLVAIFISIRFEWRMAVAALAAMAHDVIVTVGFYSLFQFEVTPATVIAFLTILGYSLYDTIVVFDRVKENEGKFAGVRMPYEDIVNISMNQVLMRSINTSLSSILPVISLLLHRFRPPGRGGAERVRAGAARRHDLGRLLVDLRGDPAAGDAQVAVRSQVAPRSGSSAKTCGPR